MQEHYIKNFFIAKSILEQIKNHNTARFPALKKRDFKEVMVYIHILTAEV